MWHETHIACVFESRAVSNFAKPYLMNSRKLNTWNAGKMFLVSGHRRTGARPSRRQAGTPLVTWPPRGKTRRFPASFIKSNVAWDINLTRLAEGRSCRTRWTVYPVLVNRKRVFYYLQAACQETNFFSLVQALDCMFFSQPACLLAGVLIVYLY